MLIMMKPIKFRFWTGTNFCYFDLQQFLHDEDCFSPYRETNVLQQFTGLKDRNGKEIYEGDIVCEIMTDEMAANGEESTVGQVFFAAGAFMIDDADILFNHIYGNSPNVLEDFYVIGNIFENKELMK